jgi:hypothetical protein
MGLNWAKQNACNRMARQGVESARGDEIPPAALRGPPRRRPLKADQRADLASALASNSPPVRKLPTRITVRCLACKHSATVAVILRPRLRFRCSRCGALATAG